MRMAKPVMQTQIGSSAKKKRCRVLSLAYAMTMAKAKAAAHGGTLCSCVSVAEYPYDFIIPGEK